MCLLSASGTSEQTLGVLGGSWSTAGPGEKGVRVNSGSAEGPDAGGFGPQWHREDDFLSVIFPGAAETSGNCRRKPYL